MQKLFSSTVAVIFAYLILANVLFAGDTGSWYVGVDAGINIQQNVFTTFDDSPFSGETRFAPGEQVNLKVGYNLNTWSAIELGAGFAHNGISSIGSDSVSDVDFYQVPILADIVLNRTIFHNWSVYVGGGVGGVVSLWDCGLSVRYNPPNPFIFYPGHASTKADFLFGYQALAGVKYNVSKRWDFTVGYKFLATPEGHDWTINGMDVKTDPTMSHSIFAALVYKF